MVRFFLYFLHATLSNLNQDVTFFKMLTMKLMMTFTNKNEIKLQSDTNDLKRKSLITPVYGNTDSYDDENVDTPISKKRFISPTNSVISSVNIPDISASQTTDFMIKKFVSIGSNDDQTINPLFQSIDRNTDAIIESSTPVILSNTISFPLTISPIKPSVQPLITLLVNETFLENAPTLIAVLSKDHQIVLEGMYFD
jgi:hypothetical protein